MISGLKLLLVTLGLCCFSNISKAQTDTLREEVNYLSEAPNIDGELDDHLTFIKDRDFPVKYKSNDENPDVKVTYRLAYGTNFFYVYVEVDAQKLVYRDRAYQNGDGFHMVLAKPTANNQPADEFYVLACSAVDRKNMEWSRNIFWYYNVEDIFKPTSKDTKLMFLEKEGKTSFELLLPWKDVYPYHPWISEGIGFNLAFVKAIGEEGRNIYKLLEDELGAENSNRKYLSLQFQEPLHKTETQTYLVLKQNNIKGKEILTGVSATVSAGDDKEELTGRIISDENTLVEDFRQNFESRRGVNIKHFEINKKPIPAGGYKIKWNSRLNDSKGETYLTSLPDFNFLQVNNEIEKIQDHLSASSYETLQHKIWEIDRELAEVKPYETGGDQRLAISEVLHHIEQGKNGLDIIADKRGFIRKGYRSKLDNKLIPYTVYIPEDYDHGKKYPLLVYLHGSASDETNLKGARFTIPQGFIALGPNGRGPSNCYSWDHAQMDIAEAIDAVTETYSVDKNNILLSGFSMGAMAFTAPIVKPPINLKL